MYATFLLNFRAKRHMQCVIIESLSQFTVHMKWFRPGLIIKKLSSQTKFSFLFASFVLVINHAVCGKMSILVTVVIINIDVYFRNDAGVKTYKLSTETFRKTAERYFHLFQETFTLEHRYNIDLKH